ncbi:vWA domain-containing protein [Algihabitans albus]|uniref:vWA domain-containing protein n=1 Tax=Algihabitans albus TaxID=2164067 RepID=UPI000E5C5B04|nr:VWA domain-containing protein [Algihabitans albus]
MAKETSRETTGRLQAGFLAQRMVDFVAHLRLNDFAVGPAETASALAVLGQVDACAPQDVRLGLKTLLAGRQEEWERFDDLFEAYWHRRGRTRQRQNAAGHGVTRKGRPKVWQNHLPSSEEGDAGRPEARTGDDAGVSDKDTARLAASRQEALAKTDLRHIVDPEELAEAERLAGRLARALRDRLSRRYRLASRGPRLDLRRTTRRNLAHGGDPIELVWRRRPERPMRIVVLLDVSGSMQQYSRFFLQFVKGLVCSWVEADAYLFHTRLIRVTDAMRDKDPLRAMTRLGLMTQGYGGGTRIGGSLRSFNDRYAKSALGSRSVVIVLSDGYDTGEPAELARELQRLRRKARRVVWLNPLLGWRDYAPVARGMAAALPHLDCFASAHTLEALAAVEDQFVRL